MDAGERFACWRCGKALGTRRGTDWVLGHDDHDRAVHRGPECPGCNYATATRAYLMRRIGVGVTPWPSTAMGTAGEVPRSSQT